MSSVSYITKPFLYFVQSQKWKEEYKGNVNHTHSMLIHVPGER